MQCRYSQVRWQRSEGVHLGSKGAPATAEVIAEAMARYPQTHSPPSLAVPPTLVVLLALTYSFPRPPFPHSIRDFDTGGHSYPTTAADALKNMISGGLPLTLSRQPPQPPRAAAAAEGRASTAECASDAVFAKLTQQLTTDQGSVVACVGARAVQFALALPEGGHKVYVMDFTSEDDPRVVRPLNRPPPPIRVVVQG